MSRGNQPSEAVQADHGRRLGRRRPRNWQVRGLPGNRRPRSRLTRDGDRVAPTRAAHLGAVRGASTPNEIGEKDAARLVSGGAVVVAEGSNMSCTPEAVRLLIDANVLYAPGKAANAGGVATSGLEMAQNSARLSWPREEVDRRLQEIMKAIHRACRETADAMMDQGVV